eukprot:CAMPEP_0171431158 /NCGR_PEP_ID=MMETSP0881-20121228/7062_1 /TAXON_ID=67004 /ORGANISM="Thalassiosira weissflogii, Strain CCMP1336" /LENGTH=938 /DNA_ID=CAMNT_0011951395 /DNA_START=110 /DNA_END=2923 /DNA_ORIENTATION=-
MALSSSRRRTEADYNAYDQVLKKLETTKQVKAKVSSSASQFETREDGGDKIGRRENQTRQNDMSEGAGSSDSSHLDEEYDEYLETFEEDDDIKDIDEYEECAAESMPKSQTQRIVQMKRQHESTSMLIATYPGYQYTRQQTLVSVNEQASYDEQESLISVISSSRSYSPKFSDDGLPDAVLKLDRRHAIPRPRHRNDVLVEIEASTVDRREFMIRPGVRCTETQPTQGVETTGVDCIGRVVQLTTDARAIYGVSIDDRVAALFPFEYKHQCSRRRNQRYALVDAGFVVAVPKSVDAAEAACMTRLYMTAFQSIQLGMNEPRDRYDLNLLNGVSILVQNGNTDLGQAVIELATFLGASQVFATASSEHHQFLRELGATPLGDQSFGWELFINEKLGLVFLQEMPSAEDFDSFISIIDESKGNLVFMRKTVESDDDLCSLTNDVGCDPVYFKELALKARTAINSARYHFRLSCTPQFLTYEGVWASSRANLNLFREDLRFLFTLLDSGNLKPNVSERITLEEVPDVQDRIELHGKSGSIVCLPFKTATETSLYERKAFAPNVISPHNSQRIPSIRNRMDSGYHLIGDACLETNNNNHFDQPRTSGTEGPEFKYEVDAGYVKDQSNQPPTDGLSDFNILNVSRIKLRENLAPIHYDEDPDLQPTSVPTSDVNRDASTYNVYHPYLLKPIVTASYEDHTKDHDDCFSVDETVNNTVVSDGVIKQGALSMRKIRPTTVQFRKKKLSRRERAFLRQKEAKERCRKSKVVRENGPTWSSKSIHSKSSSSHSPPHNETEAVNSRRKIRREARMKSKWLGQRRSINGSASATIFKHLHFVNELQDHATVHDDELELHAMPDDSQQETEPKMNWEDFKDEEAWSMYPSSAGFHPVEEEHIGTLNLSDSGDYNCVDNETIANPSSKVFDDQTANTDTSEPSFQSLMSKW